MPLRFALVLLLSLALPSLVHAQSRSGHVVLGLEDAPAVFVGADRAWILGAETDPRPSALCTDVLCRPIVRVELCAPPRCPGAGRLVVASERIADVSDFPTDREGFAAAQQALYGEASLGTMTPYFGAHPEPPPRPVAYAYDEEFWHFELALGGGIASGLVHITQPMWHTDATFGIRVRPRWGSSDEGLDVMLGTELGAEIRTHVVGNITGQSERDLAIFIGVGPAFGYTEGALRVPGAFSWIIPEYGFVVRTDRVPVSWYAGWTLPVTWLLDSHLAVEARANVLVVGDWYPSDDDPEILASLSVGFVLR